MGQQQLLLLVLGIVIVAMAVVSGIESINYARKRFNLEALTHTSVRLASDAQAWLQRPTAFGGGSPIGASASDFAGAALDLFLLGYPSDAGSYSDVHGYYMAEVSGSDFVITAVTSLDVDDPQRNVVCTIVSGTREDHILVTPNPPTGTCSGDGGNDGGTGGETPGDGGGNPGDGGDGGNPGGGGNPGDGGDDSDDDDDNSGHGGGGDDDDD